MPGHVEDRWTRPGDAGRRVRSDRWGKGKRWKARYPLPNGRTKTHAAATRDAAEAWLARMATMDGQYVDPRAGAVSFRDYSEQWREHQVHHRPRTKDSARIRLAKTVYPVIGDRPMSSLRRSDVQHLVGEACESLAPSTVRVMYAYVAAIFRSAVEDRIIPSSPCLSIKLPERATKRVVPLTTAQVQEIADRVPPRWRAAVILAAHSGLRSSEWRGLTVDDLTPRLHVRSAIAPQSVTVRVARQLAGREDGQPVWGEPKTGAGNRDVRLGPTAAAALAEHLAEFGTGNAGLIFHTSTGAPYPQGEASDIWRRATAGMGLADRSGWHALRHYHASVLINDGKSARRVADRLGHADPAETLRTYSHLWPSDDSDSADAAERAFKIV